MVVDRREREEALQRAYFGPLWQRGLGGVGGWGVGWSLAAAGEGAAATVGPAARGGRAGCEDEDEDEDARCVCGQQSGCEGGVVVRGEAAWHGFVRARAWERDVVEGMRRLCRWAAQSSRALAGSRKRRGLCVTCGHNAGGEWAEQAEHRRRRAT
ncbi:hypothetical protein BDU57DRAFT_523643 [Ampelomyces quisqualis]|uniref:Uncharacterized protein n=1 Tax=Ampelomyces quisqualis TaxID=50730 RepID=A0A6A5QBM4_AMPQU|nr:hypothetical protein BDU57DRAFT_523643 [Ampelomyces quisqualis]